MPPPPPSPPRKFQMDTHRSRRERRRHRVGRSQRRRRKHWSFYGDLLGRDNRALFDGSTERWLEVCNTPVVFGPEDLPKLRKAGHSPKEAVFPFRPNMMTVRIGAWVGG
jgi:hypothetical protein